MTTINWNTATSEEIVQAFKGAHAQLTSQTFPQWDFSFLIPVEPRIQKVKKGPGKYRSVRVKASYK